VRNRDGAPSIATFPARTDDHGVVRWEALALRLARNAGIGVPGARVELVAERPVLVVRRFDRRGAVRIPFLSAMSALHADERETRSYLEIADALRPYRVAVATDLPAPWRRPVFHVLISHTDDNLRNHAILYAGLDGWRLSPAYDLNPVPTDINPRVLSTAITEDGDVAASPELAMEVAGHVGLRAAGARGRARRPGGGAGVARGGGASRDLRSRDRAVGERLRARRRPGCREDVGPSAGVR
jgi:serine/threonine-protein kinase HipA